MPGIEQVLKIATAQLGVHESGGNNHGPKVKQYLSAVGLGEGYPWCAALVAWVLREAGVTSWPMTGDTWALEAHGKAHRCLFADPQRGDVFLLLGADRRPVHTGFVTGVNSGRIGTIEGNTGGLSDTDGDGVYAKSRPIRDCLFVRWANPAPAVPQRADPMRPVVRVVRNDQTVAVDCGARVEGGKTRTDLRPLVDTLGLHLTFDLASNTITIR